MQHSRKNDVSKKYKDQNDRNAKIYRFKTSPDHFLLQKTLNIKGSSKHRLSIMPPYF